MRRTHEVEEPAVEPERRRVPEPKASRPASLAGLSGLDALGLMHRAVGNRAVARLLRRGGLTGGARQPAPPEVRRAIDSPGGPIQPDFREPMEAALGRGFGAVRVHTGPPARAAAEAVGAPAFAVGQHIVVGEDVDPRSPEGIAGLAHELTHVAQQPAGQPVELTLAPRDDAAEREAETMTATLASAVAGRWDRKAGERQVQRFVRERDPGMLREWRSHLGERGTAGRVRERTALGEVRGLWGWGGGQKRKELEVDPARLTDMPTFVRNIFEFFYPGFEPPAHSEEAAKLAARMLWEAIKASRMMDYVPRPPPPAKLGFWLAKQVVQMAFRVGLDEGIYEAVRVTVANNFRTEFDLLREGVSVP